MTGSTQAIGVVSAVQGKVFAHADSGKVRLLMVGDSVFGNETIVTASGAQVEITFFDRPALFVEELQKVALELDVPAVASDDGSSALAALTSTEAARVVDISSAHAEEPRENVATASMRSSAQPGSDATAEAEGNSFVDLPRIGENLPPAAYEFPLNPPGSPPEIEGPRREVVFVEEPPPPPPDDGPDAVVANPLASSLILDESPLGLDTTGGFAPVGRSSVSANLSGNFASPVDYGADGPGNVSYTLDLVTGSGSGLYALSPDSTARGAEIQLVKSGADVVGQIGATEYFRIHVDNDPGSPTFGHVSFSLKQSLWQDTGSGDDASSWLATAAANRLKLTQTVTDVDGDSDSASINLGSNVFSVQDSSPLLASTTAVLSNEAGSHGTTGVFLASADPLLVPTLDPVLGVSLTSNIATWNTGNHYGLSTLQVLDGVTTRSVYLYVDPADKAVLYGYTDSNGASNYIVDGSDPTQKLIFTLSFDAELGRYQIDLNSPLKVSTTDFSSSVSLGGGGSAPNADVSYSSLYIAANGEISTSNPSPKITVTSPDSIGFFTDSDFGLGVGGDWVGAGEKLEFNFSADSQYAIKITPILEGGASTGSIKWTVQSSTGDYFETGVVDVEVGVETLIPTTIANIEQLVLESNGTPFSLSSISGSNQADVSQLIKVSVTDNDGSVSNAQFTVWFEGSTEINAHTGYSTGGGFGGSGQNEFLQGGSGEDFLSGAGGSDVMIGGGGADIFVWRLADIPVATVPTVDKVLDFGSDDMLDLRDLLSDASLNPSITIDNTGAGARLTVSYTEGGTLHSQEIQIAFDAGGEKTLVNDNGIVKVG